MDSTLAAEGTVSLDGKLVSFVARIRGFDVQCAITRGALEEHFWVPARADDARLMKAVIDGRNRIAAAVERKTLRAPGAPIKLTDADFNH
jgi:hypothetical protein